MPVSHHEGNTFYQVPQKSKRCIRGAACALLFVVCKFPGCMNHCWFFISGVSRGCVFFDQLITRKYSFLRSTVNGLRSHPDGSLLSVNPTLWSFPPYSLTLIKLRKSHLGNSSKLKRVFFLVAQQRLSKLVFVLAPTSVDCPRFGVCCL